jgi:hypothetical protein
MPRRAKENPVKRFFSLLGPGLTTGAADNDPSGIATYSIAGAQLGTSLLWTAFLTWPLMGFVQLMCARIGMVTGHGLAGALRQRCPRWLLFIAAAALLSANIVTVGADLSGMSDAGQMLTGINSHFLTIFFGIGIALATIYFRYSQIAFVLKWLTLVLFAYVITAFILKPNWGSVLYNTFVPSWPRGHKAWQSLVAVLGTTISPYLFFWQTSQEVEEEKAMGRQMLILREGATKREIRDRQLDVGVGTFFSNIVMYFIILTAALTLHAHGGTNVEKFASGCRGAPAASRLIRSNSLYDRACRRRPTCDSNTRWVQRIRVCRNVCVERRTGHACHVGALFLCHYGRIDIARHRDGLCKNQSYQGAVLGECYQWRSRSVHFGWYFAALMRPHCDEAPTEHLVGAQCCRAYSCNHVRCRRGDVYPVKRFYLRPPFLPPLRELDLLRFFPRPPPPFFRPPLSDLFTVAHARRSASLLLTPRFL